MATFRDRIGLSPSSHMRRAGFTILELLLTIGILMLLIALILLAVLSMRATARQMECQNRLRQIGTAVHNFESAHGYFPPGGDENLSLHVRLLPYVEQEPVRDEINRRIAADLPDSQYRAYESACAAVPQVPAVFLCPSDPAGGRAWRITGCGGTNYAGNFGSGVQRYGFNGLFRFLAPDGWGGPPHIMPQHVTDGLSNTAAVSEVMLHTGTTDRLRILWTTDLNLVRPDELEEFADECEHIDDDSGRRLMSLGVPWPWGVAGATLYSHILPPNRPSCVNGGSHAHAAITATSLHAGGVNVLLADGAVRFMSDKVDRPVWRALGARNGGMVGGFIQ